MRSVIKLVLILLKNGSCKHRRKQQTNKQTNMCCYPPEAIHLVVMETGGTLPYGTEDIFEKCPFHSFQKGAEFFVRHKWLRHIPQ